MRENSFGVVDLSGRLVHLAQLLFFQANLKENSFPKTAFNCRDLKGWSRGVLAVMETHSFGSTVGKDGTYIRVPIIPMNEVLLFTS